MVVLFETGFMLKGLCHGVMFQATTHATESPVAPVDDVSWIHQTLRTASAHTPVSRS